MRRASWFSLSSAHRYYGYALDVARFIERLEEELRPLAVILFGPLANNVHHQFSDAEVCIVLRDRPLSPYIGYDRVTAMDPSGAIRPLVYGADQFRRMLRLANPLALEVSADGVFLTGDENFCEEIERLVADARRPLGGEPVTTNWHINRRESDSNLVSSRPPATI